MVPVGAPPKQSKELSNALYDDWKRKVVDEAKKRAVAQNVDYESFKNMVSVAHLKPINAAQGTPKQERMLPSWEFNADGSTPEARQTEAAAAALAILQRQPSEAPSSSGDFYREWRRSCPSPDAKYRYLKLCGPANLALLFKVEISSEVLKDVLAVLEACWQLHAGAAEDRLEGSAMQEAAFVIQVLQSLSAAGRFSLSVKLMGGAAKKVIESLFTQLEAAVQASSSCLDANTGGAEDIENGVERLSVSAVQEAPFDALRFASLKREYGG